MTVNDVNVALAVMVTVGVEAVADVAMAATGSIFYVAPPGEDEVEAPAPAPPEKDFGPETLSEGQLADMFDSIEDSLYLLMPLYAARSLLLRTQVRREY